MFFKQNNKFFEQNKVTSTKSSFSKTIFQVQHQNLQAQKSSFQTCFGRMDSRKKNHRPYFHESCYFTETDPMPRDTFFCLQAHYKGESIFQKWSWDQYFNKNTYCLNKNIPEEGYIFSGIFGTFSINTMTPL